MPVREVHCSQLSPAASRGLGISPAIATGELREATGANRVVVERFIAHYFAERFGARIEAFMPRLFGMYGQDGEIRGAVGLRSSHHRMFLEHYLDQPIEQAIVVCTHTAVDRASIVEVGHLSGTFPGAMRTLISLLTDRLYNDGFRWIAFTGSATLRNAFRRIGLLPIEIRVASIERIPADARTAWGTYYDQLPRLLVCAIEDRMHRLVRVAAPSARDFGETE
ncbi:MAG TPA: thermostable hemolysin [Rudaea sp.]|jgi:hypothetical protein